MGGSKKNYVPYPTFQSLSPKESGYLSTLGGCRIYPTDNNDYQRILETTIQQSSAEDKPLKKKYMKQSVAMAKVYLQQTSSLDPSIINVEMVLNDMDIINSHGCIASCFLDAGCDKIVVSGANLLQLVKAMDVARIPQNNMVVHLQTNQLNALLNEETNEETSTFVSNVVNFTNIISVSYCPKNTSSPDVSVDACTNTMSRIASLFKMAKLPTIIVEVNVNAFTSNESNNDSTESISQFVKGVCKYCSSDGIAIPLGGTVTLIDPTAKQLGESFAACLSSDRADKLYTTVVCSRANEALGLVYSSIESIVAAIECGRGVYYSRSRKGLWRKGDTSGHYQTLHKIGVDCDGDALRFIVTQRSSTDAEIPAFCHLHTYTCWGEADGLRHLQHTLQSRLADAPEGSYTKRLFNDSELLRNKLVEEAQELSEAETKQHVAEELADVLYFAMVKAVKAGVSIDDAIQELDVRRRKVTRRKGDSKAFRIAAGDTILNNKNK